MIVPLALVIVCAGVGLVLGGVLLLLRRTATPDDKAILKRITHLSFRRKLRLVVALTRDSRIPLRLRAIPPALVLYMASPLDLIPDFIPVFGLLDDFLIGLVGVGLLVRFTPRGVLEDQIARLES